MVSNEWLEIGIPHLLRKAPFALQCIFVSVRNKGVDVVTPTHGRRNL